MLNLAQENKSDFREGYGGKNREKKGNRKSSRQKNNTAVSYSAAPTPTAAKWLRAQQPCGMWGDFPPWGPFPLAAAPGTAAGRVGRPSLLEAATAQTLLGAGLRGETSKI